MLNLRKFAGPAWLAVGLVAGLVVGGLVPHAPLHATATDRLENFAIATGLVDDGLEAVYYLDVLTGTLKAAVVSNQNVGFQAGGEVNLNADLATAVQLLNGQSTSARSSIQLPTAPNYVMVTGLADIRRTAAARTRPSLTLVYVAETNTGIVLAYVMDWNASAHSANMKAPAPLKLWAFERFTTAMVRSP